MRDPTVAKQLSKRKTSVNRPFNAVKGSEFQSKVMSSKCPTKLLAKMSNVHPRTVRSVCLIPLCLVSGCAANRSFYQLPGWFDPLSFKLAFSIYGPALDDSGINDATSLGHLWKWLRGRLWLGAVLFWYSCAYWRVEIAESSSVWLIRDREVVVPGVWQCPRYCAFLTNAAGFLGNLRLQYKQIW